MARPRKYSPSQEARAVGIAIVRGQTEAERQTGIPKTTIDRWLDRPECVSLRTRAREELAQEAMTVARLAWQALGNAILAGRMEPRDLVSAASMAADKAALLSGEATARTEHRDLTDVDDSVALRAAADAYVASVRGGRAGVVDAVRASAAPDGTAALPALPLPGVDPAGRLPA